MVRAAGIWGGGSARSLDPFSSHCKVSKDTKQVSAQVRSIGYVGGQQIIHSKTRCYRKVHFRPPPSLAQDKRVARARRCVRTSLFLHYDLLVSGSGIGKVPTRFLNHIRYIAKL